MAGEQTQDDMWYVLGPAKEPQGPYSTREMVTMLRAGEVHEGTRVNKAGTDDWLPLAEAVGLGSDASPNAPATATPIAFRVVVFIVAGVLGVAVIIGAINLSEVGAPTDESVATDGPAASPPRPVPAATPDKPRSDAKTASASATTSAAATAQDWLAEAAYYDTLGKYYGRIGKNLDEFVTLLAKPSDEPEWLVALVVRISRFEDYTKEIRKLKPPKRAKALHDETVAIAEMYEGAAKAVARGIDNRSENLIKNATLKLTRANERVRKAKKLMAKLEQELKEQSANTKAQKTAGTP